MAWVDTARVDNMLGSSTLRQALFALDGTYAAGVFNQYEAEARAEVISYLQQAGYASPGATLTSGSDAEAFLASRAAALMISNAFARTKGIQWPAGLRDQTEKLIQSLQALADRQLPVPGLEPSTTAGIGGAIGSETSEDIDGSRPQRISRGELKTWGA